MSGCTTWNSPVFVVGVLLLSLMLPVGPAEGQMPDGDEVGAAVSPFPQAGVVMPVPRSLELADAFPEELAVWLEPLAPNDVVRYWENPPVDGRVYPLALSSGTDGLWTELEKGGWLWTVELCSENAEALRVRFDPFWPPLGAELILYNADRVVEAYGPYTAADAHDEFPFWSPTVLRYQSTHRVLPARRRGSVVSACGAGHHRGGADFSAA